MCDRTTVLSGLDLAHSSLFKEERTEACVVSARKEHFSLFRPSIASKSLRYLALRNEQGCNELSNLMTRAPIYCACQQASLAGIRSGVLVPVRGALARIVYSDHALCDLQPF